jgi:hypothetical protein
MGNSDKEDLPGYVNDPKENPEDNIDDNIESYNDSVSFFIYDEDNNERWIRSTVTVEQTEDEDGYEEIDSKEWKESKEDSQ